MNSHTRMRRYSFPLLVGLVWMFVPYLSAQILTAERHRPCKTDTLLAYKLPYIAVSDIGRNCIWDFSNLPTDSAEIIDVSYFSPSTNDTARIGLHREHTNYYFRYAQDTLWGTGYENSRTRVRYSCPMPMMSFPFAYGDSLSVTFSGIGQYCHMLPLSVNGVDSVFADATGRLILPDLTIDTALRVHMKYSYVTTTYDTVQVTEDTYRWYDETIRYPLLEIQKVITKGKHDTVEYAKTYYIPQEPDDVNTRKSPRLLPEDTINPSDPNILCLPNPVLSDLHISYQLIQDADVYISIHYNGGSSMYSSATQRQSSGSHDAIINMSAYPVGTYVVYLCIDNIEYSTTIIKI